MEVLTIKGWNATHSHATNLLCFGSSSKFLYRTVFSYKYLSANLKQPEHRGLGSCNVMLGNGDQLVSKELLEVASAKVTIPTLGTYRC